MAARREERHEVDFQVFLSWQAANGNVQRVTGRCVDLSPSGAQVETKDPIEPRTGVLVESQQFGRMGMASIRYCSRVGLRYELGLQFNTPFMLSNPLRRGILEKVLRRKPE
jgi:hypothetical protein